MTTSTERAAVALQVLEEAAASGPGYKWPERSCVSLVEATCAALGRQAPAYGPWRKLGEGRATVAVLRTYGGMGAGHQAGLRAVGWSPMEVGEPLLACDVVSFNGEVVLADYTRHAPKRDGVDFTGLAGPDGHVWGWGANGLSHVVEGRIGRVTRCG